MFGAKTGQKIVLIQYKKDFVPLILSDLVHRASHITLLIICVSLDPPLLLLCRAQTVKYNLLRSGYAERLYAHWKG